jgi:hypothetical protein
VESLKGRGVKLHLLDLGGDIAGNGFSKVFGSEGHRHIAQLGFSGVHIYATMTNTLEVTSIIKYTTIQTANSKTY